MCPLFGGYSEKDECFVSLYVFVFIDFFPFQDIVSTAQVCFYYLIGAFHKFRQGRIHGGGGGGAGGQDRLLWETPKLHKEGKKVACVCAKTPRFST